MAKKAKASYGNEDIVHLKGPDQVRMRPAVIFGSDGIEGCEHSFFEILSNAIDEAREGHGNKIIITQYSDYSLEVQDFGRGIPVEYNQKEKRFNWELVFCELYAGGKYNTNQAGSSYTYSLGLNGLGLCATQFASEYMDAEIITGGFKYNFHFEKGFNKGGMQKEVFSGKQTGTKIRWKPDLKVFTDINIPTDYLTETIKRQSVVNAGVTFVFKKQIGSGNKFETTEFYYEHGITDYVEELAAGSAFSTVQYWEGEAEGRDREDLDAYKVKMTAALCFSNKVQCKEFYHNSSFLEHGGSPDKAVKTAFINQIDAYLRNNNKYVKTDGKITIQDIDDCLILVVSSFSTQTSYENQTKKAITNKFIQDALTEMFKHQLEIYFIENKDEAEKITTQVLINMRSRVRAEASRVAIKTKLKNSTDMINRVEKFVDCRSKTVEERELYIVEGDSAKGSVVQGRFPEFQAVMPVRGKILNCLKSDYAKIFKSPIITDLIRVLGCGVEVETKGKKKDINNFDINALRWNKIIICTDADVDGFQIRTLILTMIYRLMPTLINEGKVFIAESPLFEITYKDQTFFAYSEAEKVKVLEEIGEENSKKIVIQRSKGLGENDPEMMNMTTMNPKTRRLIKVEPEGVENTFEMFNLLLGDNLQGRKDYITSNGHLYLDDADLM